MSSGSLSEWPRLAYYGALVPTAVQRAVADYLPEWITADQRPIWSQLIGAATIACALSAPIKRVILMYNDEIINCTQSLVALYIRNIVSWADVQRMIMRCRSIAAWPLSSIRCWLPCWRTSGKSRDWSIANQPRSRLMSMCAGSLSRSRDGIWRISICLAGRDADQTHQPDPPQLLLCGAMLQCHSMNSRSRPRHNLPCPPSIRSISICWIYVA